MNGVLLDESSGAKRLNSHSSLMANTHEHIKKYRTRGRNRDRASEETRTVQLLTFGFQVEL